MNQTSSVQAVKCVRLFLLRGFLFLILSPSFAQPALLKDINHNEISTLPSDPFSMFGTNGVLYFSANDGDHGSELWRSDGTAEGTRIIDVNPGAPASGPSDILLSGDQIFFAAFNNTSGRELWKTDGTITGTTLVKDINPGAAGIGPSDLTDMNGVLYFAAGDAEHGRELWKSDGTEAGTVLVKDINSTASNSLSITSFSTFGNYFKHVNGTLFFTPNDGVNGKELWKSDGTEAGTVLVKDITPGAGSTVFYSSIGAGNLLFFVADDGANGKALWKSDGTEAGTMIVKSMPGESFDPDKLIYFKDKLFFEANDPVLGLGLWATDGTGPGTYMVKNISLVGEPVVMGDHLYFGATEVSSIELWKSDGTEAGTVQVMNTNEFNPTFPLGLVVVAGTTLYFDAVNDDSMMGFWKSDGTEEGTVELAVPKQAAHTTTIRNVTSAGTSVFFSADNGASGFELWASDGTPEGTTLVKDINSTPVYFPTGLNMVGNSLMFINNEDANSYEVWKSDGTSPGTALVKDVAQDMAPFQSRYATTANDKLFFIANDGTHGNEVWASDGVAEGTQMVKDIRAGADDSPLGLLYSVGGDVLFSTWGDVNAIALWKSDGTGEGTIKLSESFPSLTVSSLVGVSGERLFAFNSWTLWVTDKTESGTHEVMNVNPSSSGFWPNNLTDNNGTIFFVTADGVHGAELWKSDGTPEGTGMVKDINQSLGTNHFIQILGAVDGWLYFIANDDVHGFELWKSDGTESGTMMVKDIWPGSAAGNISGFNAIGNTVFFVADDGVHGNELWKTDGTEEGTLMVKDIWNSDPSSNPNLLNGYSNVIDGILYFPADDGEHGTELWRTDGTAEGTYMLNEINQGPSSSYPMEMAASPDHLFFTANDGIHGREIWHLGHQSITFEALADRVATDNPFDVSASASSGLPVALEIVLGPATIEGSTVTLTGSGEVVIGASQEGDEVTLAANPTEQSFLVSKADQTVTFAEIPDKTTDDEPFTLEATASSGLAVAFTLSSGPATIVDDIVSITAPGTVTVVADQEGNDFYNPAAQVSRSFDVIQVVGIEETLIKKIEVFPNPAADHLMIQASGESEMLLMLLNSSGSAVWKKTLASERMVHVPLSAYPAGLYLLKVKADNGIGTIKVILE